MRALLSLPDVPVSAANALPSSILVSTKKGALGLEDAPKRAVKLVGK